MQVASRPLRAKPNGPGYAGSDVGQEDAAQRSSSGSGRSPQARRTTPQHQLSQIEKSVTHLLVATKQLLETLTHWSQGTATEGEVSDVYVRLGYEFNIACRAFNVIGVETQDLGPVPDLLRTILEETLSQEASRESLDRFLPRIRDIIINLLHGLKKKQQRLRQRTGRDGSVGSGTVGRQGSITSVSSGDNEPGRVTENPYVRSSSNKQQGHRYGSAETDNPYETVPPPRTSSTTAGIASSGKQDGTSLAATANRVLSAGVINNERGFRLGPSYPAASSSTLQTGTSANPSPQGDPRQRTGEAQSMYTTGYFPPPPPPPPTPQEEALAALQRGGELERRASRRFSAYQIQKHLGGSPSGVPVVPPAHSSPIAKTVRVRPSLMHSRQRSAYRLAADTSPSRIHAISRRISEESTQSSAAPVLPPPQSELEPIDSPTIKTPEDKLRTSYIDSSTTDGRTEASAITEASGRLDDVVARQAEQGDNRSGVQLAEALTVSRQSSRRAVSPSATQLFVSESSPPQGTELTLFLQYKSRVRKFVLADGYEGLSIARLQLAFIEKFAWNTHSNGVDLPEIYLQDPASGIRHEIEDLEDVKDRSLLVLNVEVLDEVKRHVDDGIASLRHVIEGIRMALEEQHTALARVSDRQQDATKEIARLAGTPSPSIPQLPGSSEITGGNTLSQPATKGKMGQLSEVQSLRRDLAVTKRTYSNFVSDVEASMSAIRAKAASIKTVAVSATLPGFAGDSGRSYVDAGKKALSDDSERIVNRVDDLQDLVEDLRKDVVSRGVRPLPRQLEDVSRDISMATQELKKMQEFVKREKPIWTKIWEKELQVVCDDRDLLTMQEELAADLEDDLEKAAQTFALVEEATKQQHLQSGGTGSGSRQASRNLNALAMDQAVDLYKAKDGVLGEVRALHPNHETRLEAIERAEKARQRELESRRGGEFQKELGDFVDEGRLKKRSGGVEQAEKIRKAKDERALKDEWEKKQSKEAAIVNAEVTDSQKIPAGHTKPIVPPILSSEDDDKTPKADAEDNAAHITEQQEVLTPSENGDTGSSEPEFVEAKEEPLAETNGNGIHT